MTKSFLPDEATTTTSTADVVGVATTTRNCLASIVIVLFHLLLTTVADRTRYDAGLVSEEFCQSDIFKPSCSPGNGVILVLLARLGRMRPGRCITGSYGHLGCSNDVTVVLGNRCNGRISCSVHVTDDALHSTLSCPRDLASFLEVKYVCLGVGNLFKNITSCPSNGSMHISVSSSSSSPSPPSSSVDLQPVKGRLNFKTRRNIIANNHFSRLRSLNRRSNSINSSQHHGNDSLVISLVAKNHHHHNHVTYHHVDSIARKPADSTGYLSSHLAGKFGSSECPLQFSASSGSRIKFSLIAFGGLRAVANKDYRVEVRHRLDRLRIGYDYGHHNGRDDERSGWRCYYVASVKEGGRREGCHVDVCVTSLAGGKVLMTPSYFGNSTQNHEVRINTSKFQPNKSILLYSSNTSSVQFYFAKSSLNLDDDDDDDDDDNDNGWITLAHYEAHSCSPDTGEASVTLQCSDAKGETPPSSNLDSGFSKVDESVSPDREGHNIPLGLLLVVAIGVSLGVFTGGLLLSILSVLARSNKKRNRRNSKNIKCDDRAHNEDDFLSHERHIISGKMASTSVDHFHFLIEDRHVDESHKMSSSTSSTCYRSNPPEAGFHVFPVTCDYVTEGRVVTSLGDAPTSEKKESRDSLKAAMLMTSSRCSYCFPDVLH